MSKRRFSRDLAKMKRVFKTVFGSQSGNFRIAAKIICFIVCISAIAAGVTLAIDVMEESGEKYNSGKYFLEETNSTPETGGKGEEVLAEPPEIVFQRMPEETAEDNSETDTPVKIIITCDGQKKTFNTTKKTVSGALAQAGYEIGKNDLISPSGDCAVYDGMNITVIRTVIEQYDYTVEIPYETEYRKSSSLYEGESKVIREGACGSRKITLQRTSHNGMMIESRTLSDITIANSISRIVEQGTKKKPVRTTKPPSTTEKQQPQVAKETIEVNGVVYNINKKISGEARAYYSRSSAPLTYTGNPAIPGKTVAVDPKVIPLGSLLLVSSLDDGKTWSYGPAYAHDRGGGIKGHKVDLFMASIEDCYKFGKRNCVIYIITPAR